MINDNPRDEELERLRWAAIHRYLDGLSTLPERRLVERWLADDEGLQRYVRAYRKVWARLSPRPEPLEVDPEEAWEQLQDRIAGQEGDRVRVGGRGVEHLRVIDGGLAHGPRVRRARRWRRLGTLSGVAGGIVVAVATALVVRRETHPPVREPERVSAPTSSLAYATNRGETRSVHLPDGTDVVLAPASELRFGFERGGADHVVSLVGQASFHVEHRTDRRFIVWAAGVEARDLGTVFDVRAYAGAPPRVAVQTDSVSIRVGGAETVVRSGYIGVIDVAHGKTVVTPVSPWYFEWTHGRRVFTDMPLRDVAEEIGRAYDLQFRIDDTVLAARTVTFTVNGGTDVQVLDALRQTVRGLAYERHGREVRLFRR